MTDTRIFPAWSDIDTQLWSRQPIQIAHRLHAHDLFSRDALAELIAAYPREHYSLVAMGARGDRRVWREGEIGAVSGHKVIDAIATGRMWLNLRNVSGVAAKYREMLDEMFGELAGYMPGFDAPKRQCGILISSPSAQVYYHADLPGQCLFQIAGAKRVYIYPASAPFITGEDLETIALFDVEVDMPYRPWYDQHARVFELKPGSVLNWPLNAPHRIENVDGVNVSMTVSYTSRDIRRAEIVHLANGLLRHRFGIAPKSRAITGASFWSKAVLQKLLRESGWVTRARNARRPIDFRLDGERLGEILDLAEAA